MRNDPVRIKEGGKCEEPPVSSGNQYPVSGDISGVVKRRPAGEKHGKATEYLSEDRGKDHRHKSTAD